MKTTLQKQHDIIKLEKQVEEEGQAKSLELQLEKQRRSADTLAAIDASRKLIIQKKQLQIEREKQEKLEFAENQLKRVNELDQAERQEREEELLRQEQVKQFHLQQMETKKRKLEEEFKKELAEDTKAIALQDEQDKIYYSYAEKAIKQWSDSGKNIKPLVIELKNYKKKVL